MQALSIRQPWAWLIIHGYKDVENRTWATFTRGLIYVHAGKGMTKEEYDEARHFALSIDLKIPFPAFGDLERGGIVGTVKITGCTQRSRSDWFVGPHGFDLAEAKALAFTPCKGALGFFTPEAQP